MIQRIFRYGDHTIADPGPEYTAEQVRAHLVTYFPELAKATTQENTLPDGTVEITFHKQVTTKGNGYTAVLTGLEAIPPLLTTPYEQLLTELTSKQPDGTPLTFQTLHQYGNGIADALVFYQNHRHHLGKVIAACQHIPPTHTRQLPISF